MDEHDPNEPGTEKPPGAPEDAPKAEGSGAEGTRAEPASEENPFEYTLQIFQAAPEPDPPKAEPAKPEPVEVLAPAEPEPAEPKQAEPVALGSAIPPDDLEITDAAVEEEVDLTPAQTDADAPAEEIVASSEPPPFPTQEEVAAHAHDEEADLTPAQTDADAPAEEAVAAAVELKKPRKRKTAPFDAQPPESVAAPVAIEPEEPVVAGPISTEAEPEPVEAAPAETVAEISEPEAAPEPEPEPVIAAAPPIEAAEPALPVEETPDVVAAVEAEPVVEEPAVAVPVEDTAEEVAAAAEPVAEAEPEVEQLFGADASPESVFEESAEETPQEIEAEAAPAESIAEPEIVAEAEVEPDLAAAALEAEPEPEPEPAIVAAAPEPEVAAAAAPAAEDEEPELQAAAMEAAEDQPEEADAEIVTRSLYPRGIEVGGRSIEHTPPPFPEKAEPTPAEPKTPAIAGALGAQLTDLAARVGLKAKKPGAPANPIEWKRPKAFDARRIAIMAMGMVFLMVAGVCVFFIYVTSDIPSTKSLWTADNSPSLTFVDRRGRAIIREGAEAAPPVDLNRLPAYVPNAVIAIEDRRFFEHFGLDASGLMRAAAENFRAGHVVQGGSTITQQLAKNLFLSNNRTFRRKLQEVALALWLESQFSKREILALYMSRVYFGAGAYGVEAAAERYFDKPAKDLTLAEAALLAGLVKAPSKLNPAAQDAAAKARAKIVLDEMLAANFITGPQHTAALRAPLAISRRNPSGNLGYFRDWIDPQLTALIGDQRDDFIVETTLDLEGQRAGEMALQTVIEREKKTRRVSQGALLAMDATGGVTTMVGGLNYGKEEGQSEFNRTTQSMRAPGSSFKYFIYMAAMDQGLTPWTVRVDKPIVIGDWAPGNYENKYFGPVTLTSAYAKSLNMVAIGLANEVGGQAVIDEAHKLGVGKRLENYRSLGLGAQGMTVMEMVTGYGAMAAGGYPIEPHGIERIRRSNGQILWARRQAAEQQQVIDPRTVRMMNFLGATVVRAGTGTGARIEGREIAGKTGTSNDYRDAWFIGYVPGYVAGVWLGNDDNTPMNKVTGGLLSTEVWKGFMTVALRDTPIQPLEMPGEDEYPAVVLPTTPMEVIPEAPAISEVTAPAPALIPPPQGRNARRGRDGRT